MAQPKPYLSPEAYLEIERQAETKSESFDGEMFAMAGAGPAHNDIVANIIGTLGTQLKKRSSRVYPSAMRLLVCDTGQYTYPDVMVVCGPPEFVHGDTLLNPKVIVEVLSPSTEVDDRGRKSEQYRTIESLQEYLLIPQDSMRVEQYTRQPDGTWLLRDLIGPEAVVLLSSIDCALPLIDVFDRVEFPERTALSSPRAEPGPG